MAFKPSGEHPPRRPLWLSVLLPLLLCCGACSLRSLHIGAEPWEREWMARAAMRLDDLIEDDVDDHIYFSKEASAGGRGFGGGGCGCN